MPSEMRRGEGTTGEMRRDGATTGENRPTNALVSVEGAAAERPLVRAAGRSVAAAGGRLTVLSVMPEGAFADRRSARHRTPGLPSFTLARAENERRRAAASVARAALADLAVPFEAVGLVGREAARVVAEARRRDCGHVFLGDLRRASLGAATAESVREAVTASFPGPVTVVDLGATGGDGCGAGGGGADGSGDNRERGRGLGDGAAARGPRGDYSSR
jgi:nucleotide-binding universal stress UspA family protein